MYETKLDQETILIERMYYFSCAITKFGCWDKGTRDNTDEIHETHKRTQSITN